MYSKKDQVKFVEDSLQKNWSDMVCLDHITSNLRLSSTNFTWSFFEYIDPYLQNRPSFEVHGEYYNFEEDVDYLFFHCLAAS